MIGRREFLAGAALAAGLRAQPKRRLKIGHTGIAWGYKPEDAPAGIRDAGALGYYGYETFGEVLEAWDAKGGVKRMLDESHIPLISGYCNFNLTDSTKRADEIARAIRWAKLIRDAGGSVAVIGPNGVRRSTYDFKAGKAELISTLNQICQALQDNGITAALHQHTGTCIENRDEVYAVLEAADTRYVKFGPDVGQLAKGGADPVKIVKDHLSLIRHVHLKDWDGGPYWEQYCPLGKGKVDLPAVLDLLEQASALKIVMVELDPTRNQPNGPLESAQIAKDYLKKLGYGFAV